MTELALDAVEFATTLLPQDTHGSVVSFPQALERHDDYYYHSTGQIVRTRQIRVKTGMRQSLLEERE
jgi:hypothetical protein